MPVDNTPTALFAVYEQDFTQIIGAIRRRLEAPGVAQATAPVEERKALLRSIELELGEADDLISQLELEIQGIPGSIRPAYALRLRHAKTELSKYSKASKDAQAQVQRNELTARSAAGSNLNANRFQDNPYTDTDDEVNVRSRLVGGVEILSAGQRRLRDSQGVALRTEELGADILRTLRSQRETIEHTRDTLGDAEAHINRASGTLRGMITQMYQQRIILGLIATFFIILVVLILYLKFRR